MKLNIQLFADAEVSIKFDNKVTNQGKLKKYAETLEKIRNTSQGIDSGILKQLNQASTTVNKVATNTSELTDEAKKLNKTMSTAFETTGIALFINATKKLAATMAVMTKSSFDFLENLNLFSVAFHESGKDIQETTKEARRFTNTLTEMYGLDESWVVQTTGKFKQLANAMGLTQETGTKVAQLLTQMSLDISSLYNVDFNRASSTLSSAISGQTKPIRGVAGADITQGTLQTTLDNLGIDRAVASLSFAEKRLLIIISLTQQLNNSIGDMGRTIESPANQMRVLNSQWQTLSRNVGNVFLPILEKILPYLNAILMVLNLIISALAKLFGFKESDAINYASGLSDEIDDMATGLGTAATNAKKLKQGLRGFDKLNVITTPSSGGSGAGGGGIGGIDKGLLNEFGKAFDEYQNRLDKVRMRATEIRDKILEWLGFTVITDKKTNEVYIKFKKITSGTVLGALAVGGSIYVGVKTIIDLLSRTTLFKNIGGMFTGIYGSVKKVIEAVTVLGGKDGLLYIFYDSKLYKGIETLTASFAKLASTIGLSSGALLGIIAIITALGAAFIYAYKNNDEFREKIDKLVKTVKDTVKPILEDLQKLIVSIWKEVLQPLWEKVIQPLGNFLIGVFADALGLIVDLVQKIVEFVQPFMPVLEKIAKIYLQWVIDQFSKIIDKAEKIIKKLKEAYEDYIKPIYKYVKETLFPYLEEKFEPIKKALEEINSWLDKISGTKKVEIDANTKPFKNKLKDIAKSMGNGVLTALFPNVSGIYSKIMALQKGGMPDVGQLFVANEKGPELVGQIGGKSFVANQNQMMDLLDRKLGQTNANPINATFVIQVGNKEIAKQVINDLQGMAKSNGKPITIGG